jgi:hypothetical protein
MSKSILYKDYIILVSAEFDEVTKFWVGRAEISQQHNPKVLKTILGPEKWHTTEFEVEYFMTSAAKGWIDDK